MSEPEVAKLLTVLERGVGGGWVPSGQILRVAELSLVGGVPADCRNAERSEGSIRQLPTWPGFSVDPRRTPGAPQCDRPATAAARFQGSAAALPGQAECRGRDQRLLLCLHTPRWAGG